TPHQPSWKLSVSSSQASQAAAAPAKTKKNSSSAAKNETRRRFTPSCAAMGSCYAIRGRGGVTRSDPQPAEPGDACRARGADLEAGEPASALQMLEQLRGVAGVACRGETEQPLPGLVADLEPLHELDELGLADALAAGQLLEGGVRVADAGTAGGDLRADDGLDRLAQHLPVVVEVGGQHLGRRIDLTEAPFDVVEREHGVSDADADVALRRRVG